MFKRPDSNYSVEEDVIDRIVADQTQTINQIAGNIRPNSTVLDIGAGSGVLARVIKKIDKNIIIDAIEPNPFASEIGKQFYRNFYVGYAQDYLGKISEGNYDYIILADVLEHVSDPLGFLREIVENSKKNVIVIVSIPNVTFGAVRLSLLNGNFDYVDSGLLERTHLRFFSKKTFVSMLSNTDLFINKEINLEKPFYRVEFSRSLLRANFLTFFSILWQKYSRSYQFIFILSKQLSDKDEIFIGKTFLRNIFDHFFYRKWIIKVVKKCLFR